MVVVDARLARIWANSRLRLVGGCVGLAISICPAAADTIYYEPRTTFGEVGILDMPSAHMAQDGEIAFTASALHGTQHYNATFQILPWLEGSFRYSHTIRLFNFPEYYDRSFGLKIRLMDEDRTTPDISVGLRDILGTGVFSAEYLVASKHLTDFDVSLGVGWGRLAESGALPNPFGLIFPSFKTRPLLASVTGTVNVGQFFHGPDMGVFGGVIWRTPIENLQLLVEYSSDRYNTERQYHAFQVRTPVNVGLSYRPYDSIVFSAGWFYGSSVGATLTIKLDPTVPNVPMRLGPEVPAPAVRTAKEQVDALALLLSNAGSSTALTGTGSRHSWVELPDQTAELHDLTAALITEGMGIRDAESVNHTLLIDASLRGAPDAQCNSFARIAANFSVPLQSIALTDVDDAQGRVTFCKIQPAGKPADNLADLSEADLEALKRRIIESIQQQLIKVDSVSIDAGVIWVVYSNETYRSESEAAGRIARILMATAPTNVELFHLVSVKHGLPMRDFRIARSGLERAATASGSARELKDAVDLQLPDLDPSSPANNFGTTLPSVSWAIGPGIREGFFDPDRPLQLQILAALTGEVVFTPNIAVDGRIEANIWNNYNFSRASNSVLPHVRSDAQEYFRHGSTGIASLEFNYRSRIAPDVFVGFKAGYLESMFAGAGAQILWRPDGERFAIGADVYEVWQRNFDRLFGLQDYHVTTGHVSIYYQSPWHGLNFNLHMGRYLAGDYGATFELTRRFDTGIEIGAFATFTNVPFSKFGEGSFDKGIVIRVPLEWGLPFFSQSSYDLLVRSLTRDGGQRLDLDDSLYDETMPTSYGEIERNLEDIVAP